MYLSFGADNSATINRCLQSTARVYCEFAGAATDENATPAPTVYTGGAVIYQIGAESSYLLTNYHVLVNETADGAPVSDIIHCYLYGSYNGPNKETGENGVVTVNYGDGAISCEYVGGSATYDMAVLKVSTADLLAKNPQAAAVTFADEYFVGQTAIDTVRAFNADVCFVSCHGLCENGLVTDTSVQENDVRRAILEQSKRKVLLIDSGKIGKGCWHNLCYISFFDDVFCDQPLPEPIAKHVKNFHLIDCK